MQRHSFSIVIDKVRKEDPWRGYRSDGGAQLCESVGTFVALDSRVRWAIAEGKGRRAGG